MSGLTMGFFKFSLTLAFLGISAGVIAQERAAGGAIETQMTWSSLSSQISAVENKTTAVNSRVDQIVLCSKKGMVYAPGASGIDGEGCLNPKNSDLIDKIVACGDSGLVYDKSSNTCIKGVADVKVPNCVTDVYKARDPARYDAPAPAAGYSCTLYNSYIDSGGTHSKDKTIREYICVRTRCS